MLDAKVPARSSAPRDPVVVSPAMPQNVPSFEFSDRAKQVRAFVFEFWCEHGRGPTLREVHEATELDRRQIIQAYKELQLGIVITVDENTQNCNLLKAPPFSSYPSQVRAYIDDEFHSFVGCASEAVAFSHMPPFKDKTVRLESMRRSMVTVSSAFMSSSWLRTTCKVSAASRCGRETCAAALAVVLITVVFVEPRDVVRGPFPFDYDPNPPDRLIR